jgi:predicted PhzF superfamily epimerase YddE/YHI9
MGRPGDIEVQVRSEHVSSEMSPPFRAFIGGNAVTILRGEIEL